MLWLALSLQHVLDAAKTPTTKKDNEPNEKKFVYANAAFTICHAKCA